MTAHSIITKSPVQSGSMRVHRILKLVDHYNQRGGNTLAAGITYFCVLSLFPLLMLVFAGFGFFFSTKPTLVTNWVTTQLGGELATQVNEIIATAIAQRNTVLGIGALTAIWSGISLISHLRFALGQMWDLEPAKENFLITKLKDLLAFIALLLALGVAGGITGVGAWAADHLPNFLGGFRIIVIIAGIFANFLLVFGTLRFLPRAKVPTRATASWAIGAAVIFELFKQLASWFFQITVTNPAGAAFGPIIGIMVLFFVIWRIILYTCAAAATAPTTSVAAAEQEVSVDPELS